ncbi:MAG: hypothetical protein WCA37_06045, partial [Terracidiphilus sp.]
MNPAPDEHDQHVPSDPTEDAGAMDHPEIDSWLRLASGQLSASEADALLMHAASCSQCLEMLKQSQNALSGEPKPEEIHLMQGFGSASPQWQRRLALRLARTAREAPLHKFRWRQFAGWVVPVAAALAVLGIALLHRHATSPERLLAEAYAHNRIFDLRMHGAEFAPVTSAAHLRGGVAHRETASLLSARAAIERQLERTPDDPHWLQMQARAQLMEENYDAAIDVLDRLIASGPVTATLLVDDASAYFERGTATGSENDRATALDYLRRADELAPDDPVVLFNEALVMEDRAQLMNAVETWNRYLKFEGDTRWLAEGRQRLQTLEARLKELKSHQSRVEQHLASPAAMRALASDPATLSSLDEELSTTMLPRLLDSAFPLPADRSRGSPCPDLCQSARMLLDALARSLELHHHDPWLHQLLPAADTSPTPQFAQAVRELALALDTEVAGDYLRSQQGALASYHHFLSLANMAGADRALLENAYDLQRLGRLRDCSLAARSLLHHDPQFIWIQSSSLTEAGICDEGPGSATLVSPFVTRAAALAQQRHFSLLAMRIRNQIGGAAVESGDAEDSWRIFMQTIRQFYAGDYPPFRGYTILAGLAEVEKITPRLHLELLLQRELLGILELTPSHALIPSQRYDLAIAAIRAGYIPEAKAQLAKARSELTQQGSETSNREFLADSEIAMANLYLSRNDPASASPLLDSAQRHLQGLDDAAESALYAAARGQLQLALGHPDAAEPILRSAILVAESEGHQAGESNIVFARQNRSLYATLAAVWLAQGRPGISILALWERYRLRILGQPVSRCPGDNPDCLAPRIQQALASAQQSGDELAGVIVLPDRVLHYRAINQRVEWDQENIQQDQLLAAAANLERAASTPTTSLPSVEQAARRIGPFLVPDLRQSAASGALLLIEADPLLGNLPWPAVATEDGPIGLRFNLEETPSLILSQKPTALSAQTRPLIVGASIGAGMPALLPEALGEARAVASFDARSTLLLGGQATEEQIAGKLPTASLIHFAGHAALYDGSTRLLLAPASLPGDRPYLDASLL